MHSVPILIRPKLTCFHWPLWKKVQFAWWVLRGRTIEFPEYEVSVEVEPRASFSQGPANA